MAELKVGHEILTLGRVVRPSPISMAGPLLPFEAFKLSVGHFFQKKVSVSAKQAALKKPHQFICMLDVLGGHMESSNGYRPRFPGVLTTVLRLSADLRAAAPSVKGLRGTGA